MDRGVGHVQRDKDLLAHEIGVGYARDTGDDVVEDAVAQVGIPVLFAGRQHQLAVAPDGLLPGRGHIRLVLIEEVIVQRQAAGVAGHAANGGLVGIAGAGRDLGVAEIVVDRAVQVDQAPLHEHHQTGGSDRLGYGGQRVEHMGSSQDALLAVGPAKALLPEHLALPRHGDGEGGKAALDEQRANQVSEDVPLAMLGVV